jgi:hypothetical protein
MSICRASGEYLERCQRRVLGAAFVSIILAIEFHSPRDFYGTVLDAEIGFDVQKYFVTGLGKS